MLLLANVYIYIAFLCVISPTMHSIHILYNCILNQLREKRRKHAFIVFFIIPNYLHWCSSFMCTWMTDWDDLVLGLKNFLYYFLQVRSARNKLSQFLFISLRLHFSSLWTTALLNTGLLLHSFFLWALWADHLLASSVSAERSVINLWGSLISGE